MAESYRSILEEMINDEVHGASWYFLKLADLIEAGYREGINVESMIHDITMIRPGMAPLENIAELLNQANPVKLAKAIRAYWREAREGIRVNSLTLKGRVKVIITISYSSNARLLAESVGARVIALESHPGGEGKMWGNHGGLIIPDLTMSYFMTNADALVMGGDGLYEGFIVNKIGSLPLALTARYFGKPVIIVLESFKVRKSKPMIMHKINVSGIEVPLFDEIPLNLVDTLVTDVGVFTNISVDYIAGKFKERLLKHI
mgnify:CR=1 FL=1